MLRPIAWCTVSTLVSLRSRLSDNLHCRRFISIPYPHMPQQSPRDRSTNHLSPIFHHSSIFTTHFSLIPAQRSPLNAHRSPLNPYCSLLSSLLTVHSHCSLSTAHGLLFNAHPSPLVPISPLTPHPAFTRHPLQLHSPHSSAHSHDILPVRSGCSLSLFPSAGGEIGWEATAFQSCDSESQNNAPPDCCRWCLDTYRLPDFTNRRPQTANANRKPQTVVGTLEGIGQQTANTAQSSH